ncbi:TorF family putative porin [Marinicaulis aureus]|uniref:TorF family putative porin n=1 Tax=Hyphococcus aureus TaxID=2666033 RepID=A0ABW1L3R5_9PROT
MRSFLKLSSAAAALIVTSSISGAAFAQEESESPISFSANVTLTSDYRFRGVSQTEEDLALQGGFDAAHESGFYVGTWASNLAGWGTFGGSNLELDIYGGYATDISDFGVDVGVVWYLFPGGLDRTSYGEIYGSVAKSVGPLDLTVGANYAFKQDALSLNDVKQDNIYVYGDAGVTIADSPVSVSAHLGYTDGNPATGPNGWVPSPTGTYLDWALGVSYDLPWGPIAISATYVDTNISESEAASYQLVNSGYRYGIGDAAAVFAISASF